jgi:hypothetical protein
LLQKKNIKMESTIKKAADSTVTITTTFKPQGDLLDQETALQIGLHEAGRLALLEAIIELVPRPVDGPGRQIFLHQGVRRAQYGIL